MCSDIDSSNFGIKYLWVKNCSRFINSDEYLL